MKRSVLLIAMGTFACTYQPPSFGQGSSVPGHPTPTFPIAFSGDKLGGPHAADAVATAPIPTIAPPATPSLVSQHPAPTATLVAAAPQLSAYALIIGVEHYRDIPGATGAASDAQIVAQIMRQTIGIKEEHLRVVLEDHATKSDITSQLDWLVRNASAGGQVFFYFSGHGAPAPDQSSYILPYEANLQNISDSGVPLSYVMSRLGEAHARDVLALVDSCFSGAGGRSMLPAGARPLMRVRVPPPSVHMALFTASGGDEISGSALGETGGVFTKFLTAGLGKGLADGNGDGQISLQELADYVEPRVAQDAQKAGRAQHPHIVLGSGAGDASGFAVAWGYPTN